MKTIVNNTIFEDGYKLEEQYRVTIISQVIDIKIWLNIKNNLFMYDVSHHYQRSDQGAPYISSDVYAHTSLDAIEKAVTYLKGCNTPEDDQVKWKPNSNF